MSLPTRKVRSVFNKHMAENMKIRSIGDLKWRLDREIIRAGSNHLMKNRILSSPVSFMQFFYTVSYSLKHVLGLSKPAESAMSVDFMHV